MIKMLRNWWVSILNNGQRRNDQSYEPDTENPVGQYWKETTSLSILYILRWFCTV
jgi:hypothetical protein